MIPLLERAGEYLARIFRFPFQWGIPDQTLEVTDFRRRFFRYDADRFRPLIIGAEHIIRCLIIWKAYRKMRDEDVAPRRYIPPPHNPNPGPREPAAPMHHLFETRGLPLHEPKPPPFRISLPPPSPSGEGEGLGVRLGSTPPHPKSLSPEIDSQERFLHGSSPHTGVRDFSWTSEQPLYDGFARPESRSKRKRNDDIAFHEKLYLRMERLSDLYESLDDRAARLAARWSGQLLSEKEGCGEVRRPGACHREPTPESDLRSVEHERREGAAALSRECCPGRRTAVSIRPLKSHDPPPDTLRYAPDDMAQDIHTLHDVAIRTADAFAELCVDS